MWLDRAGPCAFVIKHEMKRKPDFRQAVSGAFRPFNKRKPIGKRIFPAEFIKLRRAFEAVEIEVMHGETRCFVGLEQSEGGAWHVVRHAQRLQQRARECRFARAERAFERKRIAALENGRKTRSELFGRGNVGKGNRIGNMK